MSRVQVALNVGDLAGAIAFYSDLFGVQPHKVRDDYANFVVDEPPLKLVLIANGGAPGTLNHIGVEVSSTDEVVAAAESAQSKGLATTLQEATSCCYALQDKVWVHGPEISWEIYTVTDENGDAGAMAAPPTTRRLINVAADGGSCGVDGSCC
ncbi:MAG: ArsI/CadI family heavy metal resistance metalloenzyme [Actinomycetota bacterium]